MRAAVVLLLLASLGRAETADEYFDIGVDYLAKGLFSKARAAFAESLVRAPAQPVPLAFLGVASTAEGRPAIEAAILFRWSIERLPKGKTLRLDLGALLPTRRTLELMQKDMRRGLVSAKEGERHHLLTVLAFLEVQDGDPAHSPALDELLKARPGDAYAKALLELRPAPPKKLKKSKKPPAKPAA